MLRFRGDMIQTFKIITGIYDNEVTEGIFDLDPNTHCAIMPTLDTDQRHINAFYFKELYWREFQNILDFRKHESFET
jgi:hypothetical protein